MKPESRPAMLRESRVLELAERFENYAQRLPRNPNACVRYTELDSSLAVPCGHRDTTVGGKLHRIAQQIFEHDLELTRIGIEQRQHLLDLPHKPQRRLPLQLVGLGL